MTIFWFVSNILQWIDSVFTGLTMGDAASALGIGPRTPHRYWAFARGLAV